MFSKKETLCLALIALAGLASYLTGLDYRLAETLGDRTPQGISLFISTDYYIAFLAGGTAYLLLKKRRAALALITSVILLYLMQVAFTEFAPRARPPQAMHIGDGLLSVIKVFGGTSSFFSGHTASSVAVSTTYMILGIHPEAMLLLAIPIMASRATLVQHYLSDVLGGILFGYVTTRVVCWRFASLPQGNGGKDTPEPASKDAHHPKDH